MSRPIFTSIILGGADTERKRRSDQMLLAARAEPERKPKRKQTPKRCPAVCQNDTLLPKLRGRCVKMTRSRGRAREVGSTPAPHRNASPRAFKRRTRTNPDSQNAMQSFAFSSHLAIPDETPLALRHNNLARGTFLATLPVAGNTGGITPDHRTPRVACVAVAMADPARVVRNRASRRSMAG